MVELEVIPACKDYGLGIIPWSPLAGGLLGGVLQKVKEGRRAGPDLQKEIKAKLDKLEAWEKFCKARGEQPAIVALAWILRNPAVTAPIIGPRTMEQLTSALRSFKIRLSKDELQKINKIWPGPGGEAPEAYAW
jgi:aryl-alcohol dehydrogenase-like predicted oxidoreductase